MQSNAKQSIPEKTVIENKWRVKLEEYYYQKYKRRVIYEDISDDKYPFTIQITDEYGVLGKGSASTEKEAKEIAAEKALKFLQSNAKQSIPEKTIIKNKVGYASSDVNNIKCNRNSDYEGFSHETDIDGGTYIVQLMDQYGLLIKGNGSTEKEARENASEKLFELLKNRRSKYVDEIDEYRSDHQNLGRDLRRDPRKRESNFEFDNEDYRMDPGSLGRDLRRDTRKRERDLDPDNEDYRMDPGSLGRDLKRDLRKRESNLNIYSSVMESRNLSRSLIQKFVAEEARSATDKQGYSECKTDSRNRKRRLNDSGNYESINNQRDDGLSEVVQRDDGLSEVVEDTTGKESEEIDDQLLDDMLKEVGENMDKVARRKRRKKKFEREIDAFLTDVLHGN